MKIQIRYYAQLRRAAAVERETVELRDGSTAIEALRTVSHGADFASILFDGQGLIRPVILLVVNDVPSGPDHTLHDGDRLAVFSPVAGG